MSPHTQSANESVSTQKVTNPLNLNQETNLLPLKRERIPTYSISKRICFYSKVNASPHTQSASESVSTQKLTHSHILNQQTNLLLIKRERIPTYSISKRIFFNSKGNESPQSQSGNESDSTQKGTHPHILHQETNLLLHKVNAFPQTQSANETVSTK